MPKLFYLITSNIIRHKHDPLLLRHHTLYAFILKALPQYVQLMKTNIQEQS